MANDDDEVGYGKPPKENQFQKGRSGNPSGRPKGSKNFNTELALELNSRIPVTEKGKRKSLTKRKVIAKQVVGAAIGGDAKALSVIVAAERAAADRKAAAAVEEPRLMPADALVLENIIARILAAHNVPLAAAAVTGTGERSGTTAEAAKAPDGTPDLVSIPGSKP